MSDFLDQLGQQFDELTEHEGERIQRRRRIAQVAAATSFCAIGTFAWSSLAPNPVEIQTTTDPAAASAPAAISVPAVAVSVPEAESGPALEVAPADLPATPLSVVTEDPETPPAEIAQPAPADAGTPDPGASDPSISATDAPAAPTETSVPEPETPPATSADATVPCGSPISANTSQLSRSSGSSQVWVDGVTVSAVGADNKPADLWVTQNRLGVRGGRYNYQLDYMPEADGSERLRLQFVEPICGFEFGVTLLERSEFEGLDEVVRWSAIGQDGKVLASETLSPNDGVTVKPSITWFQLSVPAGTTRIELGAAPYRADLGDSAGANSSDYSLVAIKAN